MERSPKNIAVLLTGCGLITIVFFGLVFLLLGDPLADSARTAFLRMSLSFREDDLNISVGNDPDPRRFTVHGGDTASAIANRLEEQSFIHDADLFADYAQYKGLDVELEAGTYFLNDTMTIKDIAIALTDSSLSQIEFTVLPGQRIEQIAENIDANILFDFSGVDFLAIVGKGAEIDPDFAWRMGIPLGSSLEGFLFPDTYSLPPEVTPLMLRDILLTGFNNVIVEQYRLDAAAQGYSIYEMVTLASIIEREAVYEEEYATIASVYRNRLETEGWRLDADPTVQYPLGESGNWWPRIVYEDYQSVISDYNTYLNFGLPPGPIANPGFSTIVAAINPATSSYFFFRGDCRGDGYHDFSETFEEHLSRC